MTVQGFFSRLTVFQGQTQEIVTGRRDQTQTQKKTRLKRLLNFIGCAVNDINQAHDMFSPQSLFVYF